MDVLLNPILTLGKVCASPTVTQAGFQNADVETRVKVAFRPGESITQTEPDELEQDLMDLD
jgi:hypothetical protein